MDAAREQRMLAKLPQKEGSELKKEEIQFIMRVEKALSKNFLFAVNRKQAGSTQFVRLHYNIRGDKNSAISSAPCKYIRCQDCGDLLYHEGSQLSKHVKSHERQGTKRKADTPIEEFIPSPLTPEEKNAVTNVLARYAIKGGVSFRSLTMPAFTEAAIALMNIGAKRKKQVNETQLKFEEGTNNSTLLRALGKSCRIALEHKLNEGFITEAHKIASFLDPRMRHMGHFSDDDREQLYNVVRSRIAVFPLTQRAPAQLSQRMEDSDSDDEGILMRRVDTPRNADEVTSYVEDHFNETASAVFTKLGNFGQKIQKVSPQVVLYSV
ncbi:hypothetical protein AAVH_28438 [Aphelenchoides avenae]|nr:hypothetical protein AAVH_28438 [Aphelenchus avenae]